MKQETVASIIKWSEETFGDNITLEGQLTKFCDELNEWLATGRTDITELADLAIVASSVARFSVIEAISCFACVAEEGSRSQFTEQQLKEAINEKQATNRSRVWEKKDGQYQHVGE